EAHESKDDEGDPPVELHRFVAERIDVELTVAAPLELPVAGGTIRALAPDRAVVDSLRVTGQLAHAANEAPPGSLSSSAQGLRLALDHLRLGSRRLDLGTLQLDAIDETELRMAGLHPLDLRTHLRGLTLGRLSLTPEPG
ncbi:MAG: hypothetical protein KC501_31145, partial [Myxococcales bacterium]|nr:hypothetical protein [Myxococcales bacterium]